MTPMMSNMMLEAGRGGASMATALPLGGLSLAAPSLGNPNYGDACGYGYGSGVAACATPANPLGVAFGSGSAMRTGPPLPQAALSTTLDGGFQRLVRGDAMGTFTDPNTGVTREYYSAPMQEPKVMRETPMIKLGEPSRMLEACTGISSLSTAAAAARACRPSEMRTDERDVLVGARLPQGMQEEWIRDRMARSAAADVFFTNNEMPAGFNDRHPDGVIGTTFVMRPVIDTQTLADNSQNNTIVNPRLDYMPPTGAAAVADLAQAAQRWGGHMQPGVTVLAQDRVHGDPRPVRDDLGRFAESVHSVAHAVHDARRVDDAYALQRAVLPSSDFQLYAAPGDAVHDARRADDAHAVPRAALPTAVTTYASAGAAVTDARRVDDAYALQRAALPTDVQTHAGAGDAVHDARRVQDSTAAPRTAHVTYDHAPPAAFAPANRDSVFGARDAHALSAPAGRVVSDQPQAPAFTFASNQRGARDSGAAAAPSTLATLSQYDGAYGNVQPARVADTARAPRDAAVFSTPATAQGDVVAATAQRSLPTAVSDASSRSLRDVFATVQRFVMNGGHQDSSGGHGGHHHGIATVSDTAHAPRDAGAAATLYAGGASFNAGVNTHVIQNAHAAPAPVVAGAGTRDSVGAQSRRPHVAAPFDANAAAAHFAAAAAASNRTAYDSNVAPLHTPIALASTPSGYAMTATTDGAGTRDVAPGTFGVRPGALPHATHAGAALAHTSDSAYVGHGTDALPQRAHVTAQHGQFMPHFATAQDAASGRDASSGAFHVRVDGNGVVPPPGVAGGIATGSDSAFVKRSNDALPQRAHVANFAPSLAPSHGDGNVGRDVGVGALHARADGAPYGTGTMSQLAPADAGRSVGRDATALNRAVAPTDAPRHLDAGLAIASDREPVLAHVGAAPPRVSTDRTLVGLVGAVNNIGFKDAQVQPLAFAPLAGDRGREANCHRNARFTHDAEVRELAARAHPSTFGAGAEFRNAYTLEAIPGRELDNATSAHLVMNHPERAAREALLARNAAARARRPATPHHVMRRLATPLESDMETDDGDDMETDDDDMSDDEF